MYNDIENNISIANKLEIHEQEINKLNESNISIAKKLERHEQEINKLNNEVFGNPCVKLISNLCSITIIVIVYLKAFGVI